MDYFIGRTQEIELLTKVFKEQRSAFVAVYGRRRIGKTELIRHVLGKQTVFHLTGIANVTTEQQ